MPTHADSPLTCSLNTHRAQDVRTYPPLHPTHTRTYARPHMHLTSAFACVRTNTRIRTHTHTLPQRGCECRCGRGRRRCACQNAAGGRIGEVCVCVCVCVLEGGGVCVRRCVHVAVLPINTSLRNERGLYTVQLRTAVRASPSFALEACSCQISPLVCE